MNKTRICINYVLPHIHVWHESTVLIFYIFYKLTNSIHSAGIKMDERTLYLNADHLLLIFAGIALFFVVVVVIFVFVYLLVYCVCVPFSMWLCCIFNSSFIPKLPNICIYIMYVTKQWQQSTMTLSACVCGVFDGI